MKVSKGAMRRLVRAIEHDDNHIRVPGLLCGWRFERHLSELFRAGYIQRRHHLNHLVEIVVTASGRWAAAQWAARP